MSWKALTKKASRLIKNILISIWFIIRSTDIRVVGAIAIRASISVIFFGMIVMLFPRAQTYWIACIQIYFFFSRLIMSFSNILNMTEPNSSFFKRKLKYMLAWEYYVVRNLFRNTLSKEATKEL
jgi:hypothetical protein